jgi:hypothetical protein
VTRRLDRGFRDTSVAKGYCVLLALIVCGVVRVGSGQTTSPPMTAPEKFGDVWLNGTVGTAEVKIYIGEASSARKGLEGIFVYSTDWSGLPLKGDWSVPGRIRLSEGDPGSPTPKAAFDLDVSQSQVTGTWTSSDGSQVLPVRLQRVPEPPRFDVAIRRPRRFQNTTWPITLSYPDGWRLVVSEAHLTLRSPDPKDLLFDNELACVRGTELPPPPASDQEPVELEWPFFRGPSGWLVPTGIGGSCEDEKCEPPEVRKTSVGLFMKTEFGYRSHGPWGYAGIAVGRAYLVVVGDEWVHCRDRLLDRDTRIGVVDNRRRR